MAHPRRSAADEQRTPDFPALAGRLAMIAAVLAVLALVGLVAEGLVAGLTFAVMVRWATIFAVAFLAVAAIATGVDALRRADAAQRRGERLSGDDVGLVPPRRRDK